MKYKLLVIIIFFISFSCERRNKDNIDYKKYSQNIIGKSEYDRIYNQAKDSINMWVYNNMSLYGYFKKYNRGYLLDSILCFNKSKNKTIGALLINHKEYENATLDDIWFFYGVKIKDNWYFFQGADITLPRNNYTKDTHTPLSFSKLHEIAMKEVFCGYLIEKKTKKNMGWWKNIFAPEYNYSYEINNKWFDSHFKGSGWGCGYMSNNGWVDTCSEKEFEILYKRKAVSKWINERQYLVHDTKIYSSIHPPHEKWKTPIEKGRRVKLIYYVEDSEWCQVVVTGIMPNGMYDGDDSYVKRSDISPNPPK